MPTFTEVYRSYITDLLPAGPFWQGPAATRLVDGFTQASTPLAKFIATLYLEIWPFDAKQPVLEQWYDYLYPSPCLPRPTTVEGLREKVLAALAAQDISSASGHEARILADLPLVEVDDLPGPSTLPLPIPAPIDGASQVVEIWYAPTIYAENVVLCVGRQYSPATAIIRPVTPIAEFRSTPSPISAVDVALHWAEQRTVSEVFVERYPMVGPAIESATVAITNEVDAKTLDELFPLLGPGDVIGGQRFEATFRRTWTGQGPTDVLPLLTFTP